MVKYICNGLYLGKLVFENLEGKLQKFTIQRVDLSWTIHPPIVVKL